MRAAQPSSFTCELIQSAETQWVSHPKVHLGCKIASWMGGSEKTTLPHTFKFTPTKAKGWMQKQPVIPLFGFWYLQMILLCKFTLKKKKSKSLCVYYTNTSGICLWAGHFDLTSKLNSLSYLASLSSDPPILLLLTVPKFIPWTSAMTKVCRTNQEKPHISRNRYLLSFLPASLFLNIASLHLLPT